ncbi:MAG: hypothetical protein EBS53_16145, partial [Bacteroidetes bacterium]|nr:hypothetical protein [Bacteroidota bacterium]
MDSLMGQVWAEVLTLGNLWWVGFTVVCILLVAVPVLLGMAMTTWFERKILGWMHLRHGPMYVGWFGLLQPFADAIKLMTKEYFIPEKSNKLMFLLAPVMIFVPALLAWAVIPLGAGLAGLFGVLLGAPTLKLRGDYLAIVTLGFGEIIRVFMNNLDNPVN